MLEQKDHAKGLSISRGGPCQRFHVRHTKCVHKVQEGQSQLIRPRTSSHLELESAGLFGSTGPIRQPSEMSSGRESSADEQVWHPLLIPPSSATPCQLLAACRPAKTPTRRNSLNTKRRTRTLTNPNTVAAAHQSRHACIHCKLVKEKVTVHGHISAILLMLFSAIKVAHGADHANGNR